MRINDLRARPVTIIGCALAAATLLVAACKDYSQDLLNPENPGLVGSDAVGSPAGAAALRVGAIGRVKLAVNCTSYECLWQEAGIMTDEFKNSDFQNTRQDIDQRSMTTDNPTVGANGGPYVAVTQSRGFIFSAIDAMKKYLPTNNADIAELYSSLAYTELAMAEAFCNGIPLGSTINGNVVVGTPLTNAQVYTIALAHTDTALALLTATDAGTVFIKNMTLILRARILVNQGQYAAAATAVNGIPTSYQYVWTSDPANNSDDNGIWGNISNTARMSVADSFDIVNGAPNTIRNALPFASANDPRVPVKTGQNNTPKIVAEDGSTPMFIQQIWGRDDPLPLASGIDARLYEAEAALQAGDYAGMMNILNTLRAAAPKIGVYQVPAMGPLTNATPTTKDAAATILFRERGFWTFGRGIRLGDLRRLIRQYGRTEDNVFPKGVYFKGGVYGVDVNMPVPDAERVNPNFTGCIDRKA